MDLRYMPIMSIMRAVFFILLIFTAAGIFAAPLEGGFALAPKDSAPLDEKERAYIDARMRVINASKKYEGTPYVYGAMSSSALDCSGLICLSFKDALGVSLPRSAVGLYSWSEKVSIDKAQPGDLIFFRTDATRNITHVGLYLGDYRFIHAASAGPKTGVIYSSLNESYYADAFAGAGRAFPEAASDTGFNTGINTETHILAGRPGLPGEKNPSAGGGKGRLILGASFAPTWNGFIKGGNLIRGFSSNVGIAAETYSLGPRMVFGLELRPEYDGALGVFRLPLTLSWGINEKIRIFAGPVLSFGDPALSIDGKERPYSGGTTWFGTIGITAAPFAFSTAAGNFSPYIEAAWQSYYYSDKDTDPAADFSAAFRFSTGVRWTFQVK